MMPALRCPRPAGQLVELTHKPRLVAVGALRSASRSRLDHRSAVSLAWARWQDTCSSAGPAAGSTGRVVLTHCSATPAAAAAPETSSGHRGWNRHPAGILVGSGGSPVSTIGSIGDSGSTDIRALV